MSPTAQTMVMLNKAYRAKRGGGTIAGFHEAHLLDTGAVAIFDEENNLILTTTLAADIAKTSKFRIAQGGIDQASSPKWSAFIDRNAFTQAYVPYVAPVLQITRVGKVTDSGTLGLPGTLLDGTVATIVVTEVSPQGYLPNLTKRYTVKVFASDTATTITTRLRDAINADVNSIVTATVVNDVDDNYVQLTSKTVGIGFIVGTDDVIATATVHKDGANGSTNNFAGVGTQAQVAAALAEDSLTRGNSNSVSRGNVQMYKYVDVLSGQSGLTFNIWTFQWKEEAHRANAVIQTATPIVALAAQVGATGLADLTTVINLVLQAPESGAGGNASGLSSGEFATVNVVPAGGEG